MIPEFDSDGELPPGIYRATLGEIKSRLARVTTSERRITLFEVLERFAGAARQSGIVVRLFIAGSFVSLKTDPGDLDLLVVYNLGVGEVDLAPGQYNVIHRARARRLFSHDLDIYPVREGSPAAREVLSFFQSNR